ncbi:hypothetical protein CL614_08980 [archaeon]|nr:hypothetical protein [archaeon]
MRRPKTIFCDIDGTLVEHVQPGMACMPHNSMTILKGTIEKLIEWDIKGYNIILTTGRRESARVETERQLSEIGIFYDQLIMGIGGGHRILINDLKPDSQEPTAIAISIKRNEGIKDVEI